MSPILALCRVDGMGAIDRYIEGQDMRKVCAHRTRLPATRDPSPMWAIARTSAVVSRIPSDIVPQTPDNSPAAVNHTFLVWVSFQEVGTPLIGLIRLAEETLSTTPVRVDSTIQGAEL